MKGIKWSVKNLMEVLQQRQGNEFDGNIAVSGDRGNGKSTLICKLLYRFKQFRPWTHQVYSRDDVISLLQNQEYGICWDDEAINSGYKRNFQEKGQQELIKILTAYRDNYNIFTSAIPNFFSLDKDLRELYFVHLHIIERGVAVVHFPLQGRLYSLDRWDSRNNAKVEAKWTVKLQKDPNFKVPHHKLSTFRGYLFFKDLTDKQKILYKEIKKEKRKRAFTNDKTLKELPFIEKVYNRLLTKQLTKEDLIAVCLTEGIKPSTVIHRLGRIFRDKGMKLTVSECYSKDEQEKTTNITEQIKSIVQPTS